jgi:hypothetical protein
MTSAPKPAAGGSSFLDEWLNKRKTARPTGGQFGPAAQAPTLGRPNGALDQPVPTESVPVVLNVNPPAPAAKQPSEPTSTQNISSDELEAKEVTQIAQELKQGLQPTTEKPGPAAANPSTKDATQSEDTIFIDQEGNFRRQQDDTSSTS